VIILDTHVWIWWRSNTPATLSPVAKHAIETAVEIGVPAVCCLEVAQHVTRERIKVDRDLHTWFEQALNGIRLLPLTPDVAINAARLLWNHRDPFDRVIVATAILHRAPLVTKDDRIRRFQGVATIW
jgi:PIN domain nuclease of toxin-antitoxin system